jgi:hypothetical protein
MIQENEIIMLLLGIGVLIFILGNRLQLQRLPVSKILIAGFHMLLAGWILTILEGFLWKDLLNFIEHTCYATSSILIAVWCWKVFESDKEEKEAK